MLFRLQYIEVGDATQFNKALQDQLTADLTESRLEYLEAVSTEKRVKEKYKRRLELRSSTTQRVPTDRKLMKHSVSVWKQRYRKKASERKTARKEYEEAHKAFESFKDEEIKGHIRENDVQKQGSQYRAKWTHLPS